MPASTTDRGRAIELLGRHSRSSESVILRYDAPWRYLFAESVEGVVAWIESHRGAVAWGGPICAPGDEPKLVSALARQGRDQRPKACLRPLEGPTRRAALGARLPRVRGG